MSPTNEDAEKMTNTSLGVFKLYGSDEPVVDLFCLLSRPVRRHRCNPRSLFGLPLQSMALVFFCSIACGDDTSFAFDVQKDVPVKALVNGSYSLTVDVGVLPSGTKGILRIRLINEDGSSFPISSVVASCGCASGTLSVDDIQPDSSAVLELVVDTPKKSKKIENSFVVNLNSNVNVSRNIAVIVKYQLGGLMCFVDEAVFKEFDSGKDKVEFTVPLLLTKPIEAADVFLGLSPPTPGVRANLTEIDGAAAIKFEIIPSAMTTAGTNLTVEAEVPGKGLRDGLVVSLTRSKEIDISPRTLRFRQVDERLTAQCILRIRSVGEVKASDDSLPSIEALIGGQMLSVHCTKLGNGVLLVKLTEKASRSLQQLRSEFEALVQWRILTSSKAFDIESKATYEENIIEPAVLKP